MKVIVEQHTFELPAAATLEEIARACGQALGLPSGRDVAVADDAGYWVLYADGVGNVGAHKDDPRAMKTTLGERHPGASEVKLNAAEGESCRHGSPGIPGYGFLCGWC